MFLLLTLSASRKQCLFGTYIIFALSSFENVDSLWGLPVEELSVMNAQPAKKNVIRKTFYITQTLLYFIIGKVNMNTKPRLFMIIFKDGYLRYLAVCF